MLSRVVCTHRWGRHVYNTTDRYDGRNVTTRKRFQTGPAICRRHSMRPTATSIDVGGCACTVGWVGGLVGWWVDGSAGDCRPSIVCDRLFHGAIFGSYVPQPTLLWTYTGLPRIVDTDNLEFQFPVKRRHEYTYTRTHARTHAQWRIVAAPTQLYQCWVVCEVGKSTVFTMSTQR